jgi:tripartite-type tricarboxylate transporter receptor subunit TctC
VTFAGTSEELADYLKAEEAKWSRVVRDAKIEGVEGPRQRVVGRCA